MTADVSAVRRAGRDDVFTLCEVLARALDDDPVFVALYPSAAHRRRSLTAMFRLWLKLFHLPHETAWTTDDVAGGALWSPPGMWKIGLIDDLKMARLVFSLGTRVVASLRVLAEIEKRHPQQPHHYLRLLGCDPSRQGQGIGSRLLRPTLDACDASGMPAYLESANERNHPFYHRHGFDTIDVITTHLGPKVWLMWREPR